CRNQTRRALAQAHRSVHAVFDITKSELRVRVRKAQCATSAEQSERVFTRTDFEVARCVEQIAQGLSVRTAHHALTLPMLFYERCGQRGRLEDASRLKQRIEAGHGASIAVSIR